MRSDEPATSFRATLKTVSPGFSRGWFGHSSTVKPALVFALHCWYAEQVRTGLEKQLPHFQVEPSLYKIPIAA